MGAVVEVCCLFVVCLVSENGTVNCAPATVNRHARWAVRTDLNCDKAMPACPFCFLMDNGMSNGEKNPALLSVTMGILFPSRRAKKRTPNLRVTHIWV